MVTMEGSGGKGKLPEGCLDYHPFAKFMKNNVAENFRDARLQNPDLKFPNYVKQHATPANFESWMAQNIADAPAEEQAYLNAYMAKYKDPYNVAQRQKRRGTAQKSRALRKAVKEFVRETGPWLKQEVVNPNINPLKEEVEGEGLAYGLGGVMYYDGLDGGVLAENPQRAAFKALRKAAMAAVPANKKACFGRARRYAKGFFRTGYSMFSAKVGYENKLANGSNDLAVVSGMIRNAWNALGEDERVQWSALARILNEIGADKSLAKSFAISNSTIGQKLDDVKKISRLVAPGERINRGIPLSELAKVITGFRSPFIARV